LGRTKIVCTIGPACASRGVLEKLLNAGMDVARLNFSHGSHEQHANSIAVLRDLARRMGRPLAILQDLSGPKVRLGTFPSFVLKRGETVGFTAEPCAMAGEGAAGTCRILPLPVPQLLSVLKTGARLLLDDGKIELRVTRRDSDVVWARCVIGGDLKPQKGVTALGVRFDVPAVTEKDRDDLRFGLEQGVDWVAASYVRRVEDLTPLHEIMASAGKRVPVIAKIEKFEAVRNFDSILAAVDGIMVARGDLGVETPFDEVPIVQKHIIRLCNRAGKPVITATQMLESMMQNPRPTRAEAADVANAILDGTDAVMLSGETAAGLFPVEAVRTMSRIALRAEAAFYKVLDFERRLAPPNDTTQSVARATANIACELNATAILCATTSGATARAVAQYRPRIPIVAVTADQATYHRLALTWGVTPLFVDSVSNTDALMESTIAAALRAKMIKHGDTVVLTTGVPVNQAGTTNLIKVHTVGIH
jgi:pyruvate kinase